MIAKECRDWLESVRDCFPKNKIAGLPELIEELGPAARGRWQIGLDSRDVFARPELRFFGRENGFDAFAKKAVKRLGLSARGGKPPAAGLPWLSFAWDMKEGSVADPWLSGSTGIHAASPFTKELLEEPALAALLEDFSALCPIEALISEWGLEGGTKVPRERWGLRLAAPEPWTRFMRLGIADPFLGMYSHLSYLNLDRRVAEISFEGARVKVYLGA
jgi:hypothetical protein